MVPPLAAIARAHRRGARVMSVCTGAFVLAHAGLLDGRRATTHWAAAAQLGRRFPAVTVDPNVLYVDEGSVLTSAGVAAGLDLCLHVVRRDHGAAKALELARRIVIAPHREGGQAQFIPAARIGSAPIGADTSTEPARAWALANLGRPLPVPLLAERVAMSPRSFARRFRAETGTTPAQWILEQRLRLAQALLETSERLGRARRAAQRIRKRGGAARPFRASSADDADGISPQLQVQLKPCLTAEFSGRYVSPRAGIRHS